MKNPLLLVLFFSISAFALPDKEIVIRTADGNSSSLLKEIKCIRFEDETMLLDMNDGSAKSWNTDDVNCITFMYSENGNTSSIGITNTAVTFNFDGKRIFINSHYYLPVLLHSIDGKAVYCQPCCGESVIEMSELPSGIYILNVNGQTYKIVNR